MKYQRLKGKLLFGTVISLAFLVGCIREKPAAIDGKSDSELEAVRDSSSSKDDNSYEVITSKEGSEYKSSELEGKLKSNLKHKPSNSNESAKNDKSRKADDKPEAIIDTGGADKQIAAESEKLGTKEGEEIYSEVTEVDLQRVNFLPDATFDLNYADKIYKGNKVELLPLVESDINFAVDSMGNKLPIYQDSGHHYLQGKAGNTYRLGYSNLSDKIYEVIVSIDNINVLDSSTGSYSSGYVLYPNQNLVIDGFRKSPSSVAPFIFSQPQESSNADSNAVTINDIGVIKTTFYELHDPEQSDS